MALLATTCRAENVGLTRNVLTNHDVVTLAKAGFSEEFIIQTILTSRTKFVLSAEDLADLGNQGLTEEIIQVMRTRRSPSATEVSNQEDPAVRKPELGSNGPGHPFRVFVEPGPNSHPRSQSRLQTDEIMRTFVEGCPSLVVTTHRERANFAVVLELRSEKGPRGRTKMAAFDHSGDLVFEASTRTLGTAVRGFCTSMQLRMTASAPGSDLNGWFLPR